ncbi:MAG: signal peptidase II [Acidobacteriota bacterium]|nr:signal peptidase II [Acidobacteriota bacterium]
MAELAAATARRLAAGRAATVCAAVIALDQVTKHTLGTWIQPGQVRHVIPGLTLVYERNTGVAFSFLAGTGALVYAVTAIALVALVAFLLARPRRRLLWLPTGMLVGGAIGNLIDRVALGSVIDFVKLPHWPAFNLADTCVTFGVIILVLVIERGSADA